ncbi:MAG TPA: hypothetical protein VGE29_07640 [Prosthecobacter sp.]
MSAETSVPPAFALAVKQVRRRVWMRRWVAWLTYNVWPVVGALLGACLAWSFTGLAPTAWPLAGVLLLWLVAGAVVTTVKMPSTYAALALWDTSRQQREAFATAWWFEQQPEASPQALTHVQTQRGLLPAALSGLAKDLPLSGSLLLVVPWLVALAAATVMSLAAPQDTAMPLDESMQAAAKAEAEKLAKTDLEKKNLAGLSEDEKAALDKLQENLKATASGLENAKGQDARQVMSELEQRAREAEKLAERLAPENENWASDKLVQALRGHADTADLGDSVAGRKAAQAATAAEALAAELKAPQLREATRDRFRETLSDVLGSAEKEDRTRLVGQHVIQAGEAAQKGSFAEAGGDFEKLADKLRDQALREKSREELEKLAQQLRDAGSNIAGQKDGGMQQMNASKANEALGQSGQQPGSQNIPQVSQNQPDQPGAGQQQQQLQPPGFGQGQNQNQGQGNPQTMQMGQAGKPGQPGQPGQSGMPMLLAPDPRNKSDKPPDALIIGDVPNPDAIISMNGQMPGQTGGREPGVGKADLKTGGTEKHDSTQTRVVTAQQNNEGQSSVRAVEGGTRQESASRTATETAVEFIQAEEEALDDAALPPGRREQVRRYFNELRRRFEKQP